MSREESTESVAVGNVCVGLDDCGGTVSEILGGVGVSPEVSNGESGEMESSPGEVLLL